MARPPKEGLDYFPIDIDMDSDDKIYAIEAEHGLESFAVLVKLLMEIYRNGYYILWREKERLIFSGKKKIPIELLDKVIKAALTWAFFDLTIYEKYHVLTSRGIQKRFVQATKKRSQIQMNEFLRLIEPENGINDKITWISTPETPVIDAKSTHRIGKNRIGKDRKEDILSGNETSPDAEVTTFIKKQKQEEKRVLVKEIIDYLNNCCKTNFNPRTDITIRLVKARWNEGYRLIDFKTVIDEKARQWLTDPKMIRYLRPITLFAPSKFESYLNEARQKTIVAKQICSTCGIGGGMHTESCPVFKMMNPGETRGADTQG